MAASVVGTPACAYCSACQMATHMTMLLCGCMQHTATVCKRSRESQQRSAVNEQQNFDRSNWMRELVSVRSHTCEEAVGMPPWLQQTDAVLWSWQRTFVLCSVVSVKREGASSSAVDGWQQNQRPFPIGWLQIEEAGECEEASEKQALFVCFSDALFAQLFPCCTTTCVTPVT